jgi:predicted transcriptional regulator
MRENRILRQMAGLGESPYDKLMKRHKRQIDRRTRVLTEEAMLLEVISRRQAGDQGTKPMPLQKIREDLEKMAKGEL